MTVATLVITPENVSGLVVGEGCFYAECSPDPKYRFGWRVRPAFCIELREDDRPVLEEVKRHLGCGAIYELDFGRYKGYADKRWHPHAKYRVTRISDLDAKVVPFFRSHPLFGRKLEAFEVWADLVALLAANRRWTEARTEQAVSLAKHLSALNGRSWTKASPTGRF